MSRHKQFTVWYDVEAPSGHWFIYKDYKCSSRLCKTFRKAMSVGRGLKQLYPDEEIVIIKYFRKNGKRYEREYVL